MSINSLRASFAVVGHPNKGKSSIVSTLARDDSIAISQQSGTTTNSAHYKIDTGKAGFELIDTPGFQRPKKVLYWLNQNATSADQRSLAVEKFVNDENCKINFPDEVELLKPIINGAAILYVVDGSRPYGVEYEAEMEILRWTGQPSMALINPIENDLFISPWKKALSQYFKIVTVFNPMQADLGKQISLLEAFSHLEPLWKRTLDQVTDDLKDNQQQTIQQSTQILSELLVDLCSYQCKQKALNEKQAKKLKTILTKQYYHWMKQTEQQAFQKMQALFSHHQTKLQTNDIEYPPDLFDSEQWYAWGLDKRQLVTVSAMTGAAAGAALDLAVAGHSFMIGAIGGGVLGFTSAFFGADKIAGTKIKGLPLGGYQALQGPVNNPNFPYVVIGRFLYLFEQLRLKNHADRTDIVMKENHLKKNIDKMDPRDVKQLHMVCKKLVSQKNTEELHSILRKLLNVEFF
jgi:GTPase Era involved in 16S rRNA processing